MYKHVVLFLGALLLGTAASAVHADTIYSLSYSACSTGCSVLPAGTVQLAQNGAGDVKVTVQLSSDYSFRRAPDSNHQALAFDLSGVSGVTIANITSGPTSQTFTFLGKGTFKDAGLGFYDYAFSCPTCAVGATSTPTRNLSFDVLANGLTESSFAEDEGYAFGVDVVGLTSAAGVGGTGNIGATLTRISPVPEPSSLLLLTTGLFGAAGAIRRKFTAA